MTKGFTERVRVAKIAKYCMPHFLVVQPGKEWGHVQSCLCFLWFGDEKTLTREVTYRTTQTSFVMKCSQYNIITHIQKHATKLLATKFA